MPDPIKNVVTVGLVLLLSLTGCGGGSKGNLGLFPNNAPTSLQFNEVASSDYESNRLNNTPTADFRVTGFYAPAHTQLKLQVKGEPAANSALNLLVGTYSRYNNGQDLGLFKLSAGENILNVGDAGGLVYVQYTVDAYPTHTHALTLTFGEGFVPTPHYVLGKTTKADWKNQLKTYTTTPDVVMESKRSFMVFSRENALRWQDNDQDSVLKAADQILDAEDAISGLDGSSEIHRRNTNQFLMTQAEDGWMYATNLRVAFSEGAAPYAFTPLITGKLPDSGDAWGVWHELGHLHQQAWTWDALGEVSVNIYALAAERSMGVKPPRLVSNDVWTAISNHLDNTDTNKDFNADRRCCKDALFHAQGLHHHGSQLDRVFQKMGFAGRRCCVCGNRCVESACSNHRPEFNPCALKQGRLSRRLHFAQLLLQHIAIGLSDTHFHRQKAVCR